MRSLKYFLSRSCLEKLYIAFVRPLLEYADIVWENCTNEEKRDIELVQHEAARIVSGATKFCNIDALLSELKWDSLAERRRKHRLIKFYQMKTGLAPSYLSNLIPQHLNQSYNLRSTYDVPNIYCNTQSYASSFLPLTINEWNALPLNIRESATLSEFKSKLLPVSNLANKLFSIGNRKFQIYHTRLRLGCSTLNYDLHRKNIVPSPLCSCGAVETTVHYLFHCPRYHELRQHYFQDLPCAHTINNFLYGDDRLTFVQNKFLFYCIQGYIAATKRFEP